MAKNVTIAGASYSDVPAVDLPQTGGGTATFTDVSDTTAQAADVAQGKQFFDALGVLTQGTASGGGASNCVSGTFKGTTTGAAMDIDLPYTGNGYPIAGVIYPTEGIVNSESGTFYDLLQRYVITHYFFIKNASLTAPTYSSSGTSQQNDGAGTVGYKSSATNAHSYSYANFSNVQVMKNVSARGNERSETVKLKSNTKMSVFIASSAYGFAANIEYTYYVIYSS